MKVSPDVMYFENGEIAVHFVLLYFGFIITLYAGNVVITKLFYQPKLRYMALVTLAEIPSHRSYWTAKVNRRRLIKFRRLSGSPDEEPKVLCLYYGSVYINHKGALRYVENDR
jgi:hypothetical protein